MPSQIPTSTPIQPAADFGTRTPAGCVSACTIRCLASLLALSGFGLQLTYLVNDIRRLLGLMAPSRRKLSRELMKDPLMRLLDMPLAVPALFALQLVAAWAIGQGWGLVWLWSPHVVQNNASWVGSSIPSATGVRDAGAQRGRSAHQCPLVGLADLGRFVP